MNLASEPWNRGLPDSSLINTQFFNGVDGVLRRQLVFKGGNGGEELGIIPVLDDGGDEELGDLYAGVTDCELWIEEKLRRVNPRLRMRIRVKQARAKRELPPNGGSWDGCAVDVVEDPEVFESLPGPVF